MSLDQLQRQRAAQLSALRQEILQNPIVEMHISNRRLQQSAASTIEYGTLDDQQRSPKALIRKSIIYRSSHGSNHSSIDLASNNSPNIKLTKSF